MTELEQLKKEYREIPVPADGPHQMLETIASAKRKRNRFKNLAKYGSVAAAAVLVLLLPGMLLFSGSFAAKEDSAYMEADKVAAESTGADGMFDMKADKIVLIYEGRVKDTDILEGIKDKLPHYMYPDVYVKVKSMPHNANGKIDRSWLKDNYKTLI